MGLSNVKNEYNLFYHELEGLFAEEEKIWIDHQFNKNKIMSEGVCSEQIIKKRQ